MTVKKWLVAALGAGLCSSAAPILAQETAPEEAPVEAEAVEEDPLVQGKALLKKRKWAEADAAFRKALEADSTSVEAYQGLGRSLIKRKSWDDAIVVYEAALEAVPDWNKALYHLGYLHRKKGDFTKAIAFYERYRDKEPDNPDAYYGLAESLRKNKQAAKALEAYQVYIDKEKRAGEAKWVKRAKGHAADLEKQLSATTEKPKVEEQVAAEEVDESEAQGNLPELLSQGDRAFESDNLTRAEQFYRAASRKDTKSVDAHYKLGVVQALRGDLPGAVASWQQVLEVNPSMKAAKDNIAKARKKMSSQAEKGVDDPALSQDVEAQVKLVGRYVEEGRLSMAMRVLDTLTDKNPESFQVRVLRGQTLMRLGRLDEARTNLELALGMQPGQAQVLSSLGQLYLRVGEEKRALYFLQRFLERADPGARDSSLDATRRTVERLSQAQEP